MPKSKPCRSCGNAVSARAKTCPSCGEPTVSKGQKLLGCLVLLIGTPLLMIGCFAVMAKSVKDIKLPPPTPWQERDDWSMALVQAQDAIRAKLKAPSSAKFASALWDGAQGHVTRDGQRYTVNSWVEAQNSFGAQLRSNFRVVLEKTGEMTWSVDEATLLE
jgi:hypothetical protein